MLEYAQAGTILFVEGEQPRGIYIIHSGTVELLFRTRNGELKPVRSGSAGELLGLGSVVSCRPHEHTARAVTPCELGYIDQESFFQMLEKSPQIWFRVLSFLSQDLNASYESLRAGRRHARVAELHAGHAAAAKTGAVGAQQSRSGAGMPSA
jgi:CRP-like cAMP-binding protein